MPIGALLGKVGLAAAGKGVGISGVALLGIPFGVGAAVGGLAIAGYHLWSSR